MIVAVDNKNGIGKNGSIPWYLHDDLMRFKAKTTGECVVMGSATAKSLPRMLPNRTNIIITSKVSESITIDNADPKLYLCNSLEEAIRLSNNRCWVIGGESVYREALPLASEVYLTRVDYDFHCDRFFPELPADEWEMTENIDKYFEPQRYSYHFQTWRRSVPLQS